MKPFYVVIKGDTSLMIVPEKEQGVDLHPILARSYQVFRNVQAYITSGHGNETTSYEHVGNIEVIVPGRSYNYSSGLALRLSFFEIKDLVDQINDYRDTPALWQLSPISSLVHYTDVCACILRKIKYTITAFEQEDLNIGEQSILIRNIAKLRDEYNLIQDEILKSQACLV